MVSSVVGEKVRKRAIPLNERIRPPERSSVSLSLTVSQRTDQNLVCMVFFCISMNEKFCDRSSMMEGVVLGSMAPYVCRHYKAQATRTKRPLAVSLGSPSNP